MKSATNASRTTKRPKRAAAPIEDTRNVKEIMQGLVETLPPDCTWDDVMYEVYVCQKIAAGLRASAEGRLISHTEVFKELGE